MEFTKKIGFRKENGRHEFLMKARGNCLLEGGYKHFILEGIIPRIGTAPGRNIHPVKRLLQLRDSLPPRAQHLGLGAPPNGRAPPVPAFLKKGLDLGSVSRSVLRAGGCLYRGILLGMDRSFAEG